MKVLPQRSTLSSASSCWSAACSPVLASQQISVDPLVELRSTSNDDITTLQPLGLSPSTLDCDQQLGQWSGAVQHALICRLERSTCPDANAKAGITPERATEVHEVAVAQISGNVSLIDCRSGLTSS